MIKVLRRPDRNHASANLEAVEREGSAVKEIWDLVDERGREVGVKYDRGSGEPIPSGLCFKVVEVWLRVEDKLLVTRRHPDKWAGLKWEVSGGGVLSGEKEAEAAVRELKEETGVDLSVSDLTLMGVTVSQPAVIYSYIATRDSYPKVTMQPEEVVDYRFVSEEQLEDMLDKLTKGTRERYKKYGKIIFTNNKK